MEKEHKSLQMETCTLEVILMESLQAMDSIIGQTEAFLREISRMDSDMGMVFGKEDQDNQINTKEYMPMIKNADTVSLPGQVEMSTKETILTTSDMDLDRCTGVTGAVTKETGKRASNMVKVLVN